MANETNDFSCALNNLLDTAGKLAQQQLDLVSSGVKAATSIVEPLAKTAIDLVGSASNTLGQVLQSVSSAIAPKK
ncbi:MAG: chlorosome envelope protein B [Chlorobium sp.]|nr:MAG: chlorosome envelope protein B [Chlorobium sp.]